MSLDFLKPKSPALIGLDVSSSAIKLVELSQNGKSLTLERYAIEALPKESVVDGNITNPDAVSDAIKRAWRSMGTSVRNVAMALPAAAVITKKIITTAGQTDVELGYTVETEANQYIPFSLDEVNLDYQELGPLANNPEEVEVVIAASKKEKVEDRVAAAESAGLKAIVMDVESYATQNAFELIQLQQLRAQSAGQIVAIVDVGASMLHITVMRDDQQLYFREQAFAGFQLTQDIQRQYNLSYEEAEAAKRTGQGLDSDFEEVVLRPYMENLALEISRGLQFFFTSTHFNKIDHLVLAGGGSVLAGLDEIVANRTQVATVLANPFVGMATHPRIVAAKLQLDAPALLIACGLALRRFDA